MSRLLEAAYNTDERVYDYSYDLAGNRKSDLLSGTGVTAANRYFGYNAANQLVAEGDTVDGNGAVIADYTYQYDANGNLVSKKDTVPNTLESYTWDRANRMLTVGDHSYVYDGLGNRIQQTISGTPDVVTDYLNDVQPGLVKLLRQTVDGTDVDHFVHAPRGIHAVDDGTDWMFAVQDGLRSVRGWADENGDVSSPVSYTPYGEPDTTVDGFAFTGEMRHEDTGLQYHRARYYSPEMATWTTMDFLETPNRYGYVSGNPVGNVDPTGLRERTFDKGLGIGDFGKLSSSDAIFATLVAGVFWLTAEFGINEGGSSNSNTYGEYLFFDYENNTVVVHSINGMITEISRETYSAYIQAKRNGVSIELDQWISLSQATGSPDPFNDARQQIVNFTQDLAQGQSRDYAIDRAKDIAGLLGGATCPEKVFDGSMSFSLLDLLAAVGIITIALAIPKGDPDNDDNDNCLDGNTPSIAAENYALKARAIYDELAYDLGGEPPAVIAVTRVKENPDADCRYFVGINNVLSPDDITESRRRHLNRARNRVAWASDVVLNQFPITVFGNTGPIGTGNGPQGHAEYNLYTGLIGRAPVVAIGVSKDPCPRCSSYFSGLKNIVELAGAG